MCGSYVHGYTNWSTSAFATFTVLLVITTHRKRVHFSWLGSNSKVPGERGATLVQSRSPQRTQTQSQRIEYSLDNKGKAVIYLFKCLKQTTRENSGEERPVLGMQVLLLWRGGVAPPQSPCLPLFHFCS